MMEDNNGKELQNLDDNTVLADVKDINLDGEEFHPIEGVAEHGADEIGTLQVIQPGDVSMINAIVSRMVDEGFINVAEARWIKNNLDTEHEVTQDQIAQMAEQAQKLNLVIDPQTGDVVSSTSLGNNNNVQKINDINIGGDDFIHSPDYDENIINESQRLFKTEHPSVGDSPLTTQMTDGLIPTSNNLVDIVSTRGTTTPGHDNNVNPETDNILKSPRTIISSFTTVNVTTQNTDGAESLVSSTPVTSSTIENDLEHNREIITTVITTTNIYEHPIITESFSTETVATTYSDGTVETVENDPVLFDTQISVVVREDATSETSTGIEEPVFTTANELTINVVLEDEILLNTSSNVSVSTENDLDNNREEVSTTTETTNVYSSDTITTTSTVVVTTITYSDGTVETEYGDPTFAESTSTETRTEILSDTIITYEDPIFSYDDLVTTNVVVLDEILIDSSQSEETTVFENEEETQDEITTVTTTTNNYSTDTITTTTTTPVTTITYSDGTVETEQGDPVITIDTTTATREEILTESDILIDDWEDIPDDSSGHPQGNDSESDKGSEEQDKNESDNDNDDLSPEEEIFIFDTITGEVHSNGWSDHNDDEFKTDQADEQGWANQEGTDFDDEYNNYYDDGESTPIDYNQDSNDINDNYDW